MSKKTDPFRKVWHSLLAQYYKKEKEIFSDQKKLNRFKAFVCKLPIRNNTIVIDNIHGNGFGENPKYIAEELLKRNNKYRIIWLVNDVSAPFPKGIIPVYRNSLRAYYEHATAKMWIYNTRNGKLTKKRKGQLLLQTWHGGLAIKKVERDAEDKLSESYISQAKEDGRTADGIIVDSKPNEDLFLRSFWLSPKCELLRFGSPRVDILISERNNSELKQRVRNSLGIPENDFFVLYAPTFRNHYTIEGYISSFDDIKKALEEKFGSTTIAFRFHPVAMHLKDAMNWGSACSVNATDYPDAQELIIAADCLITDYSSIAYDFALTRKPVFLIVKDLDEYLKDRGVYEVFYDQPFTLNSSEKMLADEIRTCSLAKMKERVDTFYEKYPTYNHGTAAKQTTDWLIYKMQGKG